MDGMLQEGVGFVEVVGKRKLGGVRTSKVTKKEMELWNSGYYKGLEARLRLVPTGLEKVRKERRGKGKDPKDMVKKSE
jgi:hypothetical protein